MKHEWLEEAFLAERCLGAKGLLTFKRQQSPRVMSSSKSFWASNDWKPGDQLEEASYIWLHF